LYADRTLDTFKNVDELIHANNILENTTMNHTAFVDIGKRYLVTAQINGKT